MDQPIKVSTKPVQSTRQLTETLTTDYISFPQSYLRHTGKYQVCAMFDQGRLLYLNMIVSSVFDQYVSKFIECLMHLRIDVKKEETDHFQQIISKAKNSHPISRSLQQFFGFIISRDLYDVRSKIKPTRCTSVEVTFSFAHKATRSVEMAESWYLMFKRPQKDVQSVQDVKCLENSFQELISLLVKLPLWEKFWGSFQSRRQIKKEYTLTYRIQYNKPPNNNWLQYNKKVQKWICPLGIQTTITLEYRQDFNKMFKLKRFLDIQKTVILKSEQQNRKKSLYQFYDQELDITFVSSDSELNPYPNSQKQMKVVGTIDQQSDDEYVIIIDEETDQRLHTFKHELKSLSDGLQIGAEKCL